MNVVRECVASEISEASFSSAWGQAPPPYGTFLTFLANGISKQAPSDGLKSVKVTLRPEGRDRIRADGCLSYESDCEQTLYADVVWLPRLKCYRGKVRVWTTPPEPKPKTIDQFVASLNAILCEDDVTLEGQVFEAAEGVNESDVGFETSYPAIFSLFERFPDDLFGMPGVLVHMMESRGNYEKELVNSLKRKPSVSALLMVSRILNDPSLGTLDRNNWMDLIRQIAKSSEVGESVHEEAQELLEYQFHHRDGG